MFNLTFASMADPFAGTAVEIEPTIQIELPHPLLRACVHRYVEMRFEVPPGQHVEYCISALSNAVLAATLSGHARLSGSTFEPVSRVPPLCLMGPLTASVNNVFTGTMHGFFVRFTPAGAYMLLGARGADLTDHARVLGEVARPGEAAALTAWGEMLLEAPDFSTRVKMADAFLLERLRISAAVPTRIGTALRVIEQKSGNVRISTLAQQLEIGESTLRRHVHDVTGVSPKLHALIARFRHAHAFMQSTPQATWADAVVRFGYTDQAHFIHEHRRFAGEPPSAWQEAARFLDNGMGLADEGARAELLYRR